MNLPDEQRRAEIAERIAAWSPKGDGLDEAQEVFVRQVVAQAAPRTSKEARTVLNYCEGYVTWLVRAGHRLDADNAFSGELVGTYRSLVLVGRPKGTADAICSQLRRLAPDVGLDSTTRQPGPQGPDPEAAGCQPTAALSAEVAGTIAGFRPTRLAGDRWDVVVDLVRRAVEAARPEAPGRARHLLRSCAYLAAWVDNERRPVRLDTVLDGATIEAFLTVLDQGGTPQRTLATVASHLHALREANGLPLEVERRSFGRSPAKAPYDPAEVDAIFRQAARIPSAGRRRHAHAALVLMFGAGMKPGACGWLPPESIVEADGLVVVRGVLPERWDDRLDHDEDQLASALGFDTGAAPAERVRRVVALDSYAEALLAARRAAIAAGDRLLLGGTTSRRGGRFSQLMKPNAQSAWAVEVDSKRAQLTWLADAITPLAARLGGVSALRKLADEHNVLDHVARQLEPPS